MHNSSTKKSQLDYQASAPLKPHFVFLSKAYRTALPTMALQAHLKGCVHFTGAILTSNIITCHWKFFCTKTVKTQNTSIRDTSIILKWVK